jgi:hypothetical protein
MCSVANPEQARKLEYFEFRILGISEAMRGKNASAVSGERSRARKYPLSKNEGGHPENRNNLVPKSVECDRSHS